jgi:hypothetical protein
LGLKVEEEDKDPLNNIMLPQSTKEMLRSVAEKHEKTVEAKKQEKKEEEDDPRVCFSLNMLI